MAKPPKTEADDPEMRRLRLRIARLRHGWATAKDAAIFVADLGAASERAYKSYDEGQRAITIEAAEKLARAFDVEPSWLRNGRGETREELRRTLTELEDIAKTIPRRMTVSGQPADSVVSQSLNQLTANIVKVDISPSQLVPTGRIPFLLAEGIASFLAGERENAMAGRMLPVSEEFAGPDFFACEIGPSDTSMTGVEGDSFPPNTVLIINTNREAWQDDAPPFYVLARQKGMKGWLFRRLEAGLPLSVATQYTLTALNPATQPIHVTDPAKWEIAGVLAAAQRTYWRR